MIDTGWSQAKEPHERLQWARRHAQYPTVRAAADSLGEKEGTYGAYERAPGSSKWSVLDTAWAQKCARRFKVSWVWLLTGEGTPFDGVLTESQARLAAAVADQTPEEQKRIAEIVEMMVRKVS